MGLEPLASRVLRRSVVSNWANAGEVHEPDALLDDVLEGRTESFEFFREAVSQRDPTPYIAASKNHLVWSSPSEDIQELRNRNASGRELVQALGMTPWEGEEAIEILYPISVAGSLYKP